MGGNLRIATPHVTLNKEYVILNKGYVILNLIQDQSGCPLGKGDRPDFGTRG